MVLLASSTSSLTLLIFLQSTCHQKCIVYCVKAIHSHIKNIYQRAHKLCGVTHTDTDQQTVKFVLFNKVRTTNCLHYEINKKHYVTNACFLHITSPHDGNSIKYCSIFIISVFTSLHETNITFVCVYDSWTEVFFYCFLFFLYIVFVFCTWCGCAKCHHTLPTALLLSFLSERLLSCEYTYINIYVSGFFFLETFLYMHWIGVCSGKNILLTFVEFGMFFFASCVHSNSVCLCFIYLSFTNASDMVFFQCFGS